MLLSVNGRLLKKPGELSATERARSNHVVVLTSRMAFNDAAGSVELELFSWGNPYVVSQPLAVFRNYLFGYHAFKW